MRHEKYSSDIAKNVTNIGITPYEILFSFGISTGMIIFEIDPLVSLGCLFGLIFFFYSKNKFLERNAISNALTKKEEIVWDKVEYHD